MVKYCSLTQFQRPLMVKYGGIYIQTFWAQVAVLAWVGEDWSLCHVRRTFCSRQYQLSNIAFEFLCTKRTAEHSQSPKTVLFVITEILTLTLVPSADVAAVNRLSPVSLPCQPTIYSPPPPPPPPPRLPAAALKPTWRWWLLPKSSVSLDSIATAKQTPFT